MLALSFRRLTPLPLGAFPLNVYALLDESAQARSFSKRFAIFYASHLLSIAALSDEELEHWWSR